MKILIAGAGGQLGKIFSEYFTGEQQISAFTHSNLDITDKEAVRSEILQNSPYLITNRAVLGIDVPFAKSTYRWQSLRSQVESFRVFCMCKF